MKNKVLAFADGLRKEAVSLKDDSCTSLAEGICNEICAERLKKIADDLQALAVPSTLRSAGIEPGKFRRADGKIFEVLGVARHTEGQGYPLVIYHPEGQPTEWMASPDGVFWEMTVSEGIAVPRFQRIEEKTCEQS